MSRKSAQRFCDNDIHKNKNLSASPTCFSRRIACRRQPKTNVVITSSRSSAWPCRQPEGLRGPAPPS
ncbi:MAG: hypothetical protein EOQ95_08645 [Mesorhizobium sp.]|nr:MAG: hypothetical protein EOQ95_08645 [Mesorhizobium sp.]RWQ54305.1 MAG: hypothetical protein EOS84_13415 [Mesorhizobium sp.]